MQCLACKEQGPDTVPEEAEQGGSRRGQGQVDVPCLSLYDGETGYSAYIRGLDHNKNEEQTNAMVCYSKVYHLSREVEYQLSVVSPTRNQWASDSGRGWTLSPATRSSSSTPRRSFSKDQYPALGLRGALRDNNVA